LKVQTDEGIKLETWLSGRKRPQDRLKLRCSSKQQSVE
jgi:hypothetical protein